MAKALSTPLLELLNSRWTAFVQSIPDPSWDRPYKRPLIERDHAKDASRLHAQANHSDPFAYGRCLRRIRSGEWLASEVRSDALHFLAARQKQGTVIFPANFEA